MCACTQETTSRRVTRNSSARNNLIAGWEAPADAEVGPSAMMEAGLETAAAAAPADDVATQKGSDDDEDDEPDSCVICLEALGDDAHALDCSHRFHAKCLIPWLQRGHRGCPMCRNKPPRDDDVADDPYHSPFTD